MDKIKSMEVATKKGKAIVVAAYLDNKALQAGQFLKIYVPGVGEVYEVDPVTGDNTGGVADIATGMRTGYLTPRRIGVLPLTEETRPIRDAFKLKVKELRKRYPDILVTENKG